MRIIAGKHKGRRIEIGKEASGIRPTSDFAREAIFNILAHGKHGISSFANKAVLDLYCGTGAFGLEALSRGAAQALFIDQSRDAIAVTRLNAERLGELEHSEFMQADATKLARARQSYALIFLDPPYFGGLIGPTLQSLHQGSWMDKDGIIVIEHDAKEQVQIPGFLAAIDERRYGRAVIKLLKPT